jgi:hypothetical protein
MRRLPLLVVVALLAASCAGDVSRSLPITPSLGMPGEAVPLTWWPA